MVEFESESSRVEYYGFEGEFEDGTVEYGLEDGDGRVWIGGA